MNKLKKSLVLLCILFLSASLMFACASPEAKTATAEEPASQEAQNEQTKEPEKKDSEAIKIGFSAFSMAQEWYQNIANGAQARADELGIELLVADANNDSNTQVQSIESFIAQGVDAIIISPVDAKALAPVMKQAEQQGILVVTESNPVDGAVTTVGQSDYDSAYKAGEWYAQYATDNEIEPKLLILGYEALQNCRDRVAGFKKALDDAGVAYEVKTEVDGGFREESLNAATDAFTANPDINTVFGINDDSALGAGAAIKAAGLNEDGIVNFIYGLEGIAGRSALEKGGMYKAGMAMFPEYVGVTCVDAAFAAINGEEIEEKTQSPTSVITNAEFDQYFIKDGDSYGLNFDAVAALN